MSGAEEAVVALKPCPFCGGKCDPQGWRGVNRSGPECEGCGSTAETVAVWNRRTDSARALLSSWMTSQGYATGHGDTIEDLLGEFKGQLDEVHCRAIELQAENESLVSALTRLREDITRKDEAISKSPRRDPFDPGPLGASALTTVGRLFGARISPDYLPDEMVELFLEDDEHWHFKMRFNTYWLSDLQSVLERFRAALSPDKERQ